MHTFDVLAAVILPDHLHMVWQLPPNDGDFPLRWRLIKTHFMRTYPRSGGRESGCSTSRTRQ